MLRVAGGVLAATCVSVTGCGGGGGGSPSAPPPQTPPPAQGVTVNITAAFPALVFDQPLDLISQDGTWFVAERSGKIFSFDASGSNVGVALDITDRVDAGGSENGLMAFEFHPGVAANGAMYVSYTGGGPLESRLSYFAFDSGTATIDPGSEQILLTVRQFAANHNGGDLLFQPGTNNLYWGQGDGGGAGDPNGNGQNPRSRLAAILRLDLSTPNVIAIPPDNPFADGADGAPEVYVYGLRNPWRFDQDPVTGILYIGDVGQATVEEINLGVPGGNYGWNCYEGSVSFSGNANCPDRGDIELPIASMGRDSAQSVTGGVVYRGTAIPGLIGKLVFGDFVTGNIWSLEQTQTGFARELIAQTNLGIVSFGVDGGGEVYIVDYFSGEIYRIVP